MTFRLWADARQLPSLVVFLAAPACFAQEGLPYVPPEKLTANAPCVAAAAQRHDVNPWVLKAILKVESDFNPLAVNKNANGTVDVGMAQINSIHFGKLAKYGIAPADLMDGCNATYVAAWHLANQIRVHGNTWFGVASYHSASPCQNKRYEGLLRNALLRWGVMSGSVVRVQTLAQCGYIAPPQSSRRAPGERLASTGSSVAFEASE
jgi:soluble lytic murein transglycosylase-like protein